MSHSDAAVRAAALAPGAGPEELSAAFATLLAAEASAIAQPALGLHPSTYALLAERAVSAEEYGLAKAIIAKFMFKEPARDQVRGRTGQAGG